MRLLKRTRSWVLSHLHVKLPNELLCVSPASHPRALWKTTCALPSFTNRPKVLKQGPNSMAFDPSFAYHMPNKSNMASAASPALQLNFFLVNDSEVIVEKPFNTTSSPLALCTTEPC